MPRLNFTVSDEVAKRLRMDADTKAMSVSRLVAHLIQKRYPREWPQGYWENLLGKWQGEPMVRIENLPLEERDFGWE